MRVLIIEDDHTIAGFVAKGFREAGFVVDIVNNAEDALALVGGGRADRARHPFDALVVDLMLPGMDGLTFIETLRRRDDATPILILSAKHTVDERIEGLKSGGDDYLTKPFSFSELLVRVQTLIRRSQRSGPSAELQVGDLTIDVIGRRVRRGGHDIELQPREFTLLEFLVRHAGQVLSKTLIMEHVWDYHFDPQTNVVDVLVSRLRKKIDADFEPKLIHTIRGVGYSIRDK